MDKQLNYSTSQMKRIFIASILCLIPFLNSWGQWYAKKYGVPDMNMLSKTQLEESLSNSKKGLMYSGISAGAGGLMIIAGKFFEYEQEEDPDFFEKLLGPDGMNKLIIVLGAGVVAGSAIAFIVYLERIGKIKSVMNKNVSSSGSLYISPAIISNRYTGSCSTGFKITYNF